jgi:hypothetical protein
VSAAPGRLAAVVVVALVLLVGLSTAAVALGVALLRALEPPGLADVGVPAAAAGCDDVVRDPGRGIATHVGPGTGLPGVTRVGRPGAALATFTRRSPRSLGVRAS